MGIKHPKSVAFVPFSTGSCLSAATIVKGWSPSALIVEAFDSVENTEMLAAELP